MQFSDLIQTMMTAAAAGDFDAAVGCFTEDGVYHDAFYGTFRGRAALRDMFAGHFHRDAEDFVWIPNHPVSDGEIGYVRYTFSYTSKLPGAEGRRGQFEGVGICKLRDGLIADYREVAEAAVGLRLLGFSDARLAKFIDREATALTQRPEMAPHQR